MLRLLIPNKLTKRQGSCTYVCNNLPGPTSQGAPPPSSPIKLAVTRAKAHIWEKLQQSEQSSLSAWQHRHQKHTQPHILLSAQAPSWGQPSSNSALQTWHPMGWVPGPTDTSCSGITISQSHSIHQESQSHWGSFTSAGNTNVTGAPPELCNSLPRNMHFQERGEKHVSGGSFSLASFSCRHTTLIPAPCHSMYSCSAVATHTFCSLTLCLAPLIPPLCIPTWESWRAPSVTTTSHPYHLPWMKRVSAWVLTSPAADFSKESLN